MSPALPVVSSQEVVTVLGKIGFELVGQRGGQVKLRNQEGRTVIVPTHRELARGGETHRQAIRPLANRWVGVLHARLEQRVNYDENAAWKHWVDLVA